jgi:hypothetical protein
MDPISLRRRDKKFLYFSKRRERIWGPPSLVFGRERGLSRDVKRREPEDDRSLPNSVVVKNE